MSLVHLRVLSRFMNDEKCRVESISVASPENYEILQTFDITDSNGALRARAEIENCALQNSIRIESFTYLVRSQDKEQSRTVLLSSEILHIRKNRTFSEFLRRSPKFIDIIVGTARFNMPIGKSYIGYGFNTGILMVYFPIDSRISIKENFMKFMSTEEL